MTTRVYSRTSGNSGNATFFGNVRLVPTRPSLTSGRAGLVGPPPCGRRCAGPAAERTRAAPRWCCRFTSPPAEPSAAGFARPGGNLRADLTLPGECSHPARNRSAGAPQHSLQAVVTLSAGLEGAVLPQPSAAFHLAGSIGSQGDRDDRGPRWQVPKRAKAVWDGGDVGGPRARRPVGTIAARPERPGCRGQ